MFYHAVFSVCHVNGLSHDVYPTTCPSRFRPLHSAYRPTIAPRRSRSRAPFANTKSCAPLRLRLKDKAQAVHSSCHYSGMSQRMLTRPVRFLTPRIIHQRTVSVFPQKFLYNKSTTSFQTRTMSDIKQISSQRAAQREYMVFI